jgi:hypothetical protein
MEDKYSDTDRLTANITVTEAKYIPYSIASKTDFYNLKVYSFIFLLEFQYLIFILVRIFSFEYFVL